MITLESVVIAVLGAVLGVVMGIGFGVALMHALREEGLEVIDVPVGQLAMFLVVSLVIGVLAALLPARRAARLDVLKAISDRVTVYHSLASEHRVRTTLPVRILPVLAWTPWTSGLPSAASSTCRCGSTSGTSSPRRARHRRALRA